MILGVVLSIAILLAPEAGVATCTDCSVVYDLRAQGVSETIVSGLVNMQVPDGAYLNDPGGLRAQRRREGDSFAGARCGIEIWDWTCPGFTGDPPAGGPLAAPGSGPPGAAGTPGGGSPGGGPPGGGSPGVPAPPSCTPVAPAPPTPDVGAVTRWPVGEIVHEVGSGDVVTGMATEFMWNGPEQVSWTQAGQPGVNADCSLIPAPVVEFTAQLQTLTFDFDGTRYTTRTGSVRHRYETDGLHQVSVMAEWVIAGTDFAALVPAGSMDHTVVEIRSTLVN